MKRIAQNKKAFHDYDILDKIEAGIVLTGDEVKSAKAGHVSLIGSFGTVHNGELYLLNAHITPYEKAYKQDEDHARDRRKLLLHKKEINKLIGNIARKGITIVPLSMYINDRGRIKIELAIAKHKKAAGKKQALKERDIRRETSRELRGRYKY